MSKKWNRSFFSTLAALNSASYCRPHFILSFPQHCLSVSNLFWVLTNWSSVHQKHFFSHSVVWTVISMRWLPYVVTMKWTMPFGNLNTRNGWKMETHQKQIYQPFLKSWCFPILFHLISVSVFHFVFLHNHSTLQRPSHSCRNPQESTGMRLEWNWNWVKQDQKINISI